MMCVDHRVQVRGILVSIVTMVKTGDNTVDAAALRTAAPKNTVYTRFKTVLNSLETVSV
jgi:hypothetical protein